MNEDFFLHYRTLSDLKNNVKLQYDDPFDALRSNISIEQVIINNPFIEDEQEIVQVLGIVGNEIGGMVYNYPLKIKVNNTVYRASTGSYLVVYKPYRKIDSLGIELTENGYLQKSALFIAGGVSKDGIKVHKFFGSKEFILPRYLLLYKSRSVLMAKLKLKGVLLTLSCFFVDLILSLRKIVLKIYSRIILFNFSIEEVSDIPNEIEDIISNNPYKFQELHNNKWFEWALKNKFGDDTHFKKHFFVVKNNSNCIIAFFMTSEKHYDAIKEFKNLYVGSVIEWETGDSKILPEKMLLLLAMMSFSKRIDVVECASTNKFSMKFFKKIGMLHVGQRNMIVRTIPKKVSEAFEGYDKIDNWRIRPAVGDTMMY